MNIYDAILRDMPQAAYAFTASATSYSSINASGVSMTSTPAGVLNNQSMTTGATKALLMASGAELRVPFSGRFSSENPKAFSLEAYVGILNPAPFVIAGHKNQSDGLRFDGDYIRFDVNFAGPLTVSAVWAVPDKTKNYHVVGTYDQSRVSLYIDGKLVSESPVPDGSVLATQTDKDIYTIATSPAIFRIEAPAYYYYSLPAESVETHYRMSRRIPDARDAVTRAGGELWTFSDAGRDILYTGLVDWIADGLADNVNVGGNELRPVYDSSNLSLAGTYTFSVPVADLDSPANTQGLKVEWNGDGNFVVEYSINNGTTWTALANGVVPTNTVNLAGTVVPLIRVTFPAGRAVNLDIVRDMRVTVYSTTTIYPLTNSERTANIVGNPTTSTFWRDPIESDKASGTTIGGSTNHITISESTQTDLQNIGTIEAWVTVDTLTPSTYFFDSRSVSPSNASYLWINSTSQLAFAGFSAVYVDGVARSSGTLVLVAGRTYHIVGVYTTPHNAKIRLTSGGGSANQISWMMMGTYPASLTAAQALALYKSYSEMPTLVATDANAVVLSESVTQTKAYVSDWAIQGAG